jgi:hypothetical protein
VPVELQPANEATTIAIAQSKRFMGLLGNGRLGMSTAPGAPSPTSCRHHEQSSEHTPQCVAVAKQQLSVGGQSSLSRHAYALHVASHV